MLLSRIAVSAYAVDLSGYTAISDKYEFAAIADNPNGKYYLADDIVFTEDDFRSGGEFFNRGKNFIAMDVFNGVLDGCGHSITGLKGNCAITEDNQGTIKNLCIESSVFTDNAICNTNNNEIINCIVKNCTAPYIVNTNSSAISYCFSYENSFFGICRTNNGTISYSINHSDITDESGSGEIGAIAAYNSGSIKYCVNKGDINSSCKSGGICGHDYGKEIIGCVNYGKITGNRAGGICQISDGGFIENCANYGIIIASSTDSQEIWGPRSWSSGISELDENAIVNLCVNIGSVNSGNGAALAKIRDYSTGTVTNNYYLTDSGKLNRKDSTDKNKSVSSAGLASASSFSELDFDSVWQISDGKPILQMENERIIGASIYSLPQKMTYKIGEAFDKAGLFVMTFDNKGNWETTNSYSVSGYTGKFGYNTVKVKCNGFENSFTVAVTDSIENCTVYPIDPVTATGKAIEIVPKIVSSRGTSLKYGTDFTLDFENNTKPGIATVHIIGKGLYYGLAETIFEIKNNISFPDVSKSAWYYDSVMYCANKGFISGYQNGNFGPNDKLKRQDFVCILARIAGADLTKYSKQTSKLNDVKKGAYYAAAVNWAVDNNIIAGYANGNFGVNDNITREQVATILYRYMGSPSVIGANSTLSKFKDVNRISSFAKTPVAWAVQEGIISGMADGRVAPTEGASRAQIASIIHRMDSQGMFD